MQPLIQIRFGNEWHDLVSWWEKVRVYGVSFERACSALEHTFKSLTGRRAMLKGYRNAKSALGRAIKHGVPYIDAAGRLVGRCKVESVLRTRGAA